MLSERIKELRKANNLTQADLAERIGVSLGAVKHWEQGKGEPNANALISMAVLFNVSTDYLVGRSPIASLIIEDESTQRILEVVNSLPEAHRVALMQYAELLREGGRSV